VAAVVIDDSGAHVGSDLVHGDVEAVAEGTLDQVTRHSSPPLPSCMSRVTLSWRSGEVKVVFAVTGSYERGLSGNSVA
jgi:hypothetical protein